jgi:beta-N-acetylhexosaminidase
MEVTGVRLLVMLDQEGGRIQRLREGFTALPPPLLLGAITDTALLSEYGAMVGRELATVGVNMNLAPSLDLATSPNNPVMRGRMYGDDGQQVSRVTNAIVAGLDRAGVISVAKHFPGHGDAADTHVGGAQLSYDLARLRRVELSPFARTTAPTLMLSHISVPALDPSALPATLSPATISYLRTELGYDGVLITDALDMGAILTRFRLADAAVQSVAAGVDLLLLGAHVANEDQIAAYTAVVDAVRAGKITEARLNQSVERLLRLKERYGLLTAAPTPLASDAVLGQLAASGGSRLLPQVYGAALTVMRDEHQLLPITAGKTVALITLVAHPQAEAGCVKARGDTAAGSAPLMILSVNHAPLPYQISQAAALAKRSDVVVVFTKDADEMPAQQHLVSVLPPAKTIVVALGSPYDWRTFPDVGAYLLTYSDSSSSIYAACEVIMGGREATGALPVALSADYPAGTRHMR